MSNTLLNLICYYRKVIDELGFGPEFLDLFRLNWVPIRKDSSIEFDSKWKVLIAFMGITSALYSHDLKS